MMVKRIAQAMTNLMPAKVSGGRSARPSLMKSQVEPQMPQSTSQTRRAFISDCRFPIADLLGRIFEFDDGERSALRINQDRKASDSGYVFGGLHDVAAELRSFLHFRIAIVDREVSEPVRGHVSHFRSDLVHASIAAIAVFEDRVFDRALGKWFANPAKHVSVKLACRRGITGAEFVPGQCAGHVVDSRTLVIFRLQDRENCLSGIFDNSHATNRANVEWTIKNGSAGGFRFFRRLIGVSDQNITQPVWRNSLGDHVRHHFIKTTDVFAAELDHGIDHVRAHGIILILPAKELGVKILRGIAIAGSEFNPTEHAGLIVGSLLHSYFTHLDKSSLSSDKKR